MVVPFFIFQNNGWTIKSFTVILMAGYIALLSLFINSHTTSGGDHPGQVSPTFFGGQLWKKR